MTDHFHHDGGSPHAEDEPDIMSLGLRIRPFDPTAYHPRAHILPPSTFYHITDFARRAPMDLLLREPESHLSHQVREVRTSLLHSLQCILHFLHISCFRYARSEHIHMHSTTAYSGIRLAHSTILIWHAAHLGYDADLAHSSPQYSVNLAHSSLSTQDSF